MDLNKHLIRFHVETPLPKRSPTQPVQACTKYWDAFEDPEVEMMVILMQGAQGKLIPIEQVLRELQDEESE